MRRLVWRVSYNYVNITKYITFKGFLNFKTRLKQVNLFRRRDVKAYSRISPGDGGWGIALIVTMELQHARGWLDPSGKTYDLGWSWNRMYFIIRDMCRAGYLRLCLWPWRALKWNVLYHKTCVSGWIPKVMLMTLAGPEMECALSYDMCAWLDPDGKVRNICWL